MAQARCFAGRLLHPNSSVLTRTSHPHDAPGVAHPAGAGHVRVLHVIDSLFLGGAEQLLVTLARHIDQQQFEVRVCTLNPDDARAPISVALQESAVPVHRAHRFARHDARHVPWLAQIIRREAIDVVHTHLAYANVTGLVAAAAARRRAVTTLHSTADRHNGLAQLKTRVQGLALQRCADVIIACSADVKTAAVERFRVASGKVVVVPNAIDVGGYSGESEAGVTRRAELLGDRPGPLIVAVGTLSSVKGHEQLVDATGRLIGEFPSIRLVIVGRDGDNAALVRERIAARGLQEHVVLAGEQTDVASFLGAADLFVHASIREGLPLAVLEAMASGVPVVATTLGGISSGGQDDVLARIAPAGNAEALAGEMSKLLRDPDDARRLASRARLYVETHYDAGAWARSLEAIYRRVIVSRATSS